MNRIQQALLIAEVLSTISDWHIANCDQQLPENRVDVIYRTLAHNVEHNLVDLSGDIVPDLNLLRRMHDIVRKHGYRYDRHVLSRHVGLYTYVPGVFSVLWRTRAELYMGTRFSSPFVGALDKIWLGNDCLCIGNRTSINVSTLRLYYKCYDI